MATLENIAENIINNAPNPAKVQFLVEEAEVQHIGGQLVVFATLTIHAESSDVYTYAKVVFVPVQYSENGNRYAYGSTPQEAYRELLRKLAQGNPEEGNRSDQLKEVLATGTIERIGAYTSEQGQIRYSLVLITNEAAPRRLVFAINGNELTALLRPGDIVTVHAYVVDENMVNEANSITGEYLGSLSQAANTPQPEATTVPQ